MNPEIGNKSQCLFCRARKKIDGHKILYHFKNYLSQMMNATVKAHWNMKLSLNLKIITSLHIIHPLLNDMCYNWNTWTEGTHFETS